MIRRKLLSGILFLLLFSGISRAADILLLFSSYCSNSTLKQLDVASRFYGLDTRKLLVEDNYYTEDSLLNIIREEKIKAIVMSADLLDLFEIQNTFLDKNGAWKINIPVMIMDITSEIDPSLLELWSGNSVSECIVNNKSSGYFFIEKDSRITAQLGGFLFPFKTDGTYQLKLNSKTKTEPLIRQTKSPRLQTVFFRTTDNRDVFFLSRIDPITPFENYNWRFRHNNFYQFAPWLIFLRYSCDEVRLHVNENFANFTVDDPWLTDPYGYFSYSELLNHMQKFNFHTTIAFIPWNYDRSKKDVVDLLSNNPDRFSICMHGNNHNQEEFNEYSHDLGDFSAPASLKDYEFSIRQALGRMEKFRQITGLAYEKVMVFPHNVAPVKALGLLKKYNFIATVNTNNVPPDSIEDLDPVWKLRSVNTLYENLPDFERYRADEITPIDIAIDLFLGNPIMISAHHDFFKDGMDAFDLIAKKINRLQPGIKWLSPGEIAKRIYLTKKSADGSVEVFPFSNELHLMNKEEVPVSYNIIRPGYDLKSIKQITIDDKNADYSIVHDSVIDNTSLIIPVTSEPKQEYEIVVEYKNNFDPAEIDISKNDWHINIMRQFADFRDMSFSTNFAGQLINELFYSTGFYQLGMKRALIVFLIIISIFVVAVKYIFIHLRKGTEHTEGPEHQKA